MILMMMTMTVMTMTMMMMMMMMIHRDFLRPARPTALERCETVLCAPAMETFTKTPVRCRESHVDRF